MNQAMLKLLREDAAARADILGAQAGRLQREVDQAQRTLDALQAKLRDVGLSRMRAASFTPWNGQNYLCPKCETKSGRTSILEPGPAVEGRDNWVCSTCSTGYVDPTGV